MTTSTILCLSVKCRSTTKVLEIRCCVDFAHHCHPCAWHSFLPLVIHFSFSQSVNGCDLSTYYGARKEKTRTSFHDLTPHREGALKCTVRTTSDLSPRRDCFLSPGSWDSSHMGHTLQCWPTCLSLPPDCQFESRGIFGFFLYPQYWPEC